MGRLFVDYEKGKTYHVVALGQHAETGEEWVLYMSVISGEEKVLLLPKTTFFEELDLPSYKGPRFIPVGTS